MLSGLPKCRFDVVLTVTHPRPNRLVNSDMIFYARAGRIARRHRAMLAILSFETPNWIEEMLGERRSPRAFHYWGKAAREAHLILSLTQLGSKYAEQYYAAFHKDLMYDHCYPAINSYVCDAVGDVAKDKRIIVMTRFTDAHKNSQSVLELINSSLRHYTLELMNGVGEIPAGFVKLLRARCSQYDVDLQVRERMSDRDKFIDLKKAQLLVFPSLFEGFGIPPIEAQYCGTRVLAFDLPVLREVNRGREGIDFVTRGDSEALKRRMVEMIAEPYDQQRVRMSISHIATFESYVERIDQTVTNAHSVFLRKTRIGCSDRR